MTVVTRCKFVVDELATGRHGPSKLTFSAVYPKDDGSDGYKHGEDHAFFNATPYARLEIHIQNVHAAELFQPGDEFYVDFTPVPKPDAAAS